jgi:hypothetical protein
MYVCMPYIQANRNINSNAKLKIEKYKNLNNISMSIIYVSTL